MNDSKLVLKAKDDGGGGGQIVCTFTVLKKGGVNISISFHVSSHMQLRTQTVGQQLGTCLLEVLNADVIHREESCCGSVLWTHVGDGGSVGDGQLSNSGAEKLHELSHNAHLPQVLMAQVEEGQCLWLALLFFLMTMLKNMLVDVIITFVTVRTMSVEVMSLSGVPHSLYPTTSGSTMLIG